jgi:two-component system, chemotaxis family, chemotaxis protein CheY
MRALVVDDDLITRIVLQEILAAYSEVYACEDGKEAVEEYKSALIRGEPYDLVCMDLLMPVMGGLEALRSIRQEDGLYGRRGERSAKVIITTAADDKDTISQAFRELCDAYVVKPIDAGQLINVVHCLFPIEEQCS